MAARIAPKTASVPVSVTWGHDGRSKARLEVVQRIGAETVRVTIVIDPSYAEQSAAWAEVLTPARTWTTVATMPVSRWHDSVAYVPVNGRNVRVTEVAKDGHIVPKSVHDLELDLFVKAAAILDV